ncbi:metallopeptidase [Stappia sp. 22II-S9-Z10]|nr:metallopeptidase [Stappia sp. 22II-S9-Z10]
MCAICELNRGRVMAAPDPGPVSDYEAATASFAGSADWHALIDERPPSRFNAMTEPGAPVIVTYGFAPERNANVKRAVADDNLIDAAREVVAYAETVTGVRFVEVPNTADPMVTFEYNTNGTGASSGRVPQVSEANANTVGGIVISEYLGGVLEPGGQGFQVMLHELGHALGLKHPHQGDTQLPYAADNTGNTVMSYNWTGESKVSYQPLDRMALRFLYGEADAFDGVTTTFNESNGAVVAKGTGGGDTLVGVNGVSILLGFSGNDLLIGREANDRLNGGGGNDDLRGLGGNDVLMAGGGNDNVAGGNGADRLLGQRGKDWLFGDGGNDLLLGGAGNDNLAGGTGNDTLNGGRGRDVYEGGSGADLFVAAAKGRDNVTDFNPREGDRIDISDLDMTASQAADRLQDMRGNLVFDTGDGFLTLDGAGGMNGSADWFFIG